MSISANDIQLYDVLEWRAPNDDIIVQVLRLIRTVRQYDVPVISYNIWGR